MSKTNATALALRLAKTYDVDLGTLSGSGSDGTVTARDVLEHRNPTSLGPADSGSEDPIQKVEVFEAAPQHAPQTVSPEDSDLEGSTQKTDETVVETAPQHAPQTQRRALILALEEAEEEEANSRRSDSDIPRWMFWRRRDD